MIQELPKSSAVV